MTHPVRRRYVTNTALYWFPVGLGVAPLVLLLAGRGLSPGTVAALISVHSFTAAALELPTGGLSDVLGRRGVLAAAGILMCAAFLLIGLGGTAVLLGVGTGLLGAARALSSGPAEAWYVDSVRAEEGPTADLRTGLARGATASSVALAVGTVTGGALPWALDGYGDELSRATGGTIVPLSTPMLLASLFALALTAHSLIALHDPHRPREAHGDTRRELPEEGFGGTPGEPPRPRTHPGDARREPPSAGLGVTRHEPPGADFEGAPGEPPRAQAHARRESPSPQSHLGEALHERPPAGLGGIRPEFSGAVFGSAQGEPPRAQAYLGDIRRELPEAGSESVPSEPPGPQAHLGGALPESPGADFGGVPCESPPPQSRLGDARRELPLAGLGGTRPESPDAGFGSAPGELPRSQVHLGDARPESPGADFGAVPGASPPPRPHLGDTRREPPPAGLGGTRSEFSGVDFGAVQGEPPRAQVHLGDTHPEPPGADLGSTPSEPPRPRGTRRESSRPRPTLVGVLRAVPSTVLDGLRLAVRDAVVRRVMFSAAAAGSALAVVELLTPGRVAAFTGAAESGAVGYAGLATLGFLCSAGGSQVAPLLGGGRRVVVVGTGVVAGALGLLAVGGDLVAVAGYVVFYVTLGVVNPNLNELLHHRVPDDRRATALSVQSLALQLTAGTTGLIIGPFATDGVLPWLFPLGAVLAVTLLWARPLRKVTAGQPVSSGGQEPRAVDLS
ncbi:MFS transporter [Streptomyces acidiscabies]|uniref:MFS transporter n=1 Tax=Streptomyces acidiscabies TaxID=42234 RepID=UPI00095210E0|nr:MFS transporter [Streptomyces acidiscabies]